MKFLFACLLGMLSMSEPSISNNEFQFGKEEQELKRAIENSISRGFDESVCQDFNHALFSIIISFDKHSKVSEVTISNGDDCLNKSRENLLSLIELNVSRLTNQNNIYSNKVIVAVVLAVAENKSDRIDPTILQKWEQLFSGFNASTVNGKSIKFLLPISMQLIPKVR